MADHIPLPVSNIDIIPRDTRIAFVWTQWHEDYIDQLCRINAKFLTDHDFVRPDIFFVPGSLELPAMASQIFASDYYDIVILFGVILK